MRKVCVVVVITAVVYLTGNVAAAQTTTSDVTTMSLEDLLKTEVISTASKFPQEIREAPASISIVTADDIRRNGYRTLGDVLKSVRGLYTSYDRNYAYVGIRGFAVPGDYNTRVLLLVDGNRLNDGVYDMAPIGTDFPVDLSLIDRVEVIRGPGSSLYGTSAFFAVVNVITRTATEKRGLQVETYGGSLATRGASLSFGRLFDNNSELLIGGSAHQSAGAARLHFPEFDSGEPNSGAAVDRDGDEAATAFVSWAIGRVTLRGAMAERVKQVPTGSYGTIFGDDRAETLDRRWFANATYDGNLGAFDLTGRLVYDAYYYVGRYPYGGDAPYVWEDGVNAQAVGGEVTVTRRVAGRHHITSGADVRRHARNQMWGGDESGRAFDLDTPGTVVGVYAQDELRLNRWLLVNAGLRFDRHPGFGNRLSPRAGVVVLPRTQTAVKLLHGHAFRAPNVYERQYYDPMRAGEFTLTPEQFTATELVWEEHLSMRLRTAVSLFEYDANDLIQQQQLGAVGGGDGYYFENVGHIEGRGIEAEVEAEIGRGVTARYSHSYSDIHNHGSVSHPANSPHHLAKFSAQAPIWRGVAAAIEGQYVSARRTNDGTDLPGFFVPNVVVTSPSDRRLALTFGFYNVFDRSYADPGGEEHVQRAIPQDGRTLLARVRVGF